MLVTGASSGIGRAIALQLARDRASLLLTARRAERLDQVVQQVAMLGGQAVHQVGDITDGQHRARLIATARTQLGGLDILINNAGSGGIGAFARAEPERLRRIMEVNFLSIADLIREALPLLRDSPLATIVNIGSVLGHCAVPRKSEYCASKFALHGFTDALRMELQPEGIDVLLVSPSTTDTEFFARATGSSAATGAGRWSMSPEAVAWHTVRAIRRGRREVILSWGGKLLVWCDRLLPGITSRILTVLG